MDNAGNPSGLSGARTLIIDRTPPSAPVVSGGSGAWTQGSVQFSATGSVGGPSGLDGYQHRTSTNGGATWSGPSNGATETVTQQGSTLVQFRAVDGAGNVSAWVGAPGPANIDTTDPSISITSPAAQDYEYGTPLTAMFPCSDALSGVASCTTPSGIVSGRPIVTTSLGTKSLTVNAADHAGNPSSQQVVFTIKDSFDPGAPGIVCSRRRRDHQRPHADAELERRGPAGLARPITGYTLKVDGQPDVNLPASTTSFTLPQLPAPPGPSFKKDYDWEVVAKDGGNNTSSVSAKFTLDLLAPPPPSVTFPSSPTNVASPVLRVPGRARCDLQVDGHGRDHQERPDDRAPGDHRAPQRRRQPNPGHADDARGERGRHARRDRRGRHRGAGAARVPRGPARQLTGRHPVARLER